MMTYTGHDPAFDPKPPSEAKLEEAFKNFLNSLDQMDLEISRNEVDRRDFESIGKLFCEAWEIHKTEEFGG